MAKISENSIVKSYIKYVQDVKKGKGIKCRKLICDVTIPKMDATIFGPFCGEHLEEFGTWLDKNIGGE